MQYHLFLSIFPQVDFMQTCMVSSLADGPYNFSIFFLFASAILLLLTKCIKYNICIIFSYVCVCCMHEIREANKETFPYITGEGCFVTDFPQTKKKIPLFCLYTVKGCRLILDTTIYTRYKNARRQRLSYNMRFEIHIIYIELHKLHNTLLDRKKKRKKKHPYFLKTTKPGANRIYRKYEI